MVPSKYLRRDVSNCLQNIVAMRSSTEEIELLLQEILHFLKELDQTSTLKSIIEDVPQVGQLLSLLCRNKTFLESPQIFQNLMEILILLRSRSQNLANRLQSRTYKWCQQLLILMMTSTAEDLPRSSGAWKSFGRAANINDVQSLMAEAVLQAVRGPSDSQRVTKSCPRSLVNYGNALLKSSPSSDTTNEIITEILLSASHEEPPVGIAALCEESSRRIRTGMLNLPVDCLQSLAYLHKPFLERELLDLMMCCASVSCGDGDMQECISSSWIPSAISNNERLFVICARMVHRCFVRSRCSPFVAGFMESVVKEMQNHCELSRIYPSHLAHLVLLLQIPVTGLTDAQKLLHFNSICRTMISSIDNQTCSKEEASILLYHFPIWFRQLLSAAATPSPNHQVDELTRAMSTSFLMRLSKDSPMYALQNWQLNLNSLDYPVKISQK